MKTTKQTRPKKISAFLEQELNACFEAYKVLHHWADTRYVKGTPFQPPGCVVWRLADVPSLISFLNKNREVVAMSGLDLWENGSIKHANVSIDEAVDWLQMPN